MADPRIRHERIEWHPSKRFRPLPLGRNLHHDERSRAFAVDATPIAGLRSVTHRRLVGIYDQQHGSCTAHACKGALSTRPFGHTYQSEARILAWYSDVTKIDPYPGIYPPDDTGSDGLSNAKLAMQRGLIGSYLHSFTLPAFLSGLQKVPAMIGVNWYDSMDYPDTDGLVRVTPNATVRGGHEMEVSRLILATPGNYAGTDRIWLPQSWGTGFGKNGWIQMELSTLDRLLHEDGDATFMQPVAA